MVSLQRFVSPCPLTNTTGGGVASLTAPPSRWGTCKDKRLGRPFCVVVMLGGGGGGAFMSGGKKCGMPEFPTAGVDVDELSCRLIVGTSLLPGLAGNVENGPSVTFLLVGGRPRSLPVDELPLLGHADDTAGPCLRRTRGLFGVIAEREPSFHISIRFEGVIAERGYADMGVCASSGCVQRKLSKDGGALISAADHGTVLSLKL